MTSEGRLNKYIKGDKVIWIVIVLLCLISLVVVYSATGSLAYRRYGGNTTFHLVKQGGFLMAGLVVVWATHMIPPIWFRRFSGIMLISSIVLLFVTLLFGVNLNDASRWIEIPGLGVSFQSSDVAKIALITYIASALSHRQKTIENLREGFLPLIIPVAIVCGLIMPANLSTALMLGIACMIMMFVGRVRILHLAGTGGAAVLAVALFIGVSLHFGIGNRAQTWVNRVTAFSGEGSRDANFQAEQSKIAIATGGFIGKGPSKSTQRNILPHPYSDFIFAIIVEEYGLFGGALVVLLYLVLLYRVGVIVRREKYTFPAFLAFGLAMLMVLQALINMAVAVNLIPVTGQTLPLVSMGGTSLLLTCVAFGMILSVSRVQNKKELFDGEQPVTDNN